MSAIKKKKVKRVVKQNHAEEKFELESLRYLRYTIGNGYNTERHMFLKKDFSKENSIIVTNVPAFLGEDIVEAFLGSFVPYKIEEILVQRSNASNGSLLQGRLTMAVSFQSSEAVLHALSFCQKAGPLVAADFVESLELPSVLRESNSLYSRLFPSEEKIEEMAETYIERYDTEQAEARREAKRKYSQPDEDGWITVLKGKKAAKSVKMKRDEAPLIGGLNNPKKRKLDMAFYTFQAKKDKQQKAQELLKKFEEDKKRIAHLKQARNFKPL
ncbi:unnamed protein product [Caenorhabditis bovis]|uniref:Ribosomal RNA-processing protein 7 C-terminal domain-containing protein n=1 Tax=Caenorhabditis bovis TaxID=2654633 RepID=A0A8S1FC63_9PELO|nr:unnamed protein product [Caenorhabditis bovis]